MPAVSRVLYDFSFFPKSGCYQNMSRFFDVMLIQAAFVHDTSQYESIFSGVGKNHARFQREPSVRSAACIAAR